MTIQSGGQFRYLEFRKRHSPPERSAPVLWPWKTLADELAAAEHTEYGSLTLSMPNGDHQIVPGTAMTFQIVPPGGRTTPHSHSWWHLYFVRSGAGSVVFDDPGGISAGDILLIPAWTVHHFENGGPDDLVLLSMTNLPQQASLGNLLSKEGRAE